MAPNRSSADATWTAEVAWSDAQDLVAHALAFSYRREGYAVLLFPDSFKEYWGIFLTQPQQAEFDSGMVVDAMSHEPPGLLSGVFRNSRFRWLTQDKEGFVFVSTFRRLE